MPAETAVYAALSGHAPLVAIVGTRIYPDVLPEDCIYPAIVFSRERTDPYYTVSGAYLGADVGLQVGCWSNSRTQADAVALASIAALAASGMPHQGQNAGYDAESALYASAIEVEVFEN